jgi:hypothetical protein
MNRFYSNAKEKWAPKFDLQMSKVIFCWSWIRENQLLSVYLFACKQLTRCSIIREVFSRKKKWSSHILATSRNLKITCLSCDRTFWTASSLHRLYRWVLPSQVKRTKGPLLPCVLIYSPSSVHSLTHTNSSGNRDWDGDNEELRWEIGALFAMHLTLPRSVDQIV